MTEITFKKGEFVSYRALTKIHLGKLERDILQGEVVQFDGQTLQYDGENHALSSLRGAVMNGWLVPDESEVTTYTPKPASLTFRSATKADQVREGGMPLGTVDDEERVVGNVNNRKQAQVEITGRDFDDQGAVAVKKIKSATQMKTVISDSSSVQREIDRLETSTPVGTSIKARQGIATGDVSEPIVGDNLADILPDAEVSGGYEVDI